MIINVYRYHLQRVTNEGLAMCRVVERDPSRARARVGWRDAWVTLIHAPSAREQTLRGLNPTHVIEDDMA